MKLTPRQREILDWILDCYMHGWLPGVRDIGDQFSMVPNGVYSHLKALRRKGYLQERNNKAGVRLTDKAISLVYEIKE